MKADFPNLGSYDAAAGFHRVAAATSLILGWGIVVLRAQARGTHSCHHRQELLKGHLEIQEAPLAKYPAIVIEDLIGNHNW